MVSNVLNVLSSLDYNLYLCISYLFLIFSVLTRSPIPSQHNVYARPAYFSTTYGDTATVIGVGNGVCTGIFFRRSYGFPRYPFPWDNGMA